MCKLACDITVLEAVRKDNTSELQGTIQEISGCTNLNRLQLNPTKRKGMRTGLQS
jgi:hypothetical protein